MRRLSLRTKLILGFGLVILINALAMGISYVGLVYQTDAIKLNNESLDAVLDTDQMLISLLKMETGMRGYVVTGASPLLAPYSSGQIEFENQVNKARERLRNDPEQLALVDELWELHEEWDKELVEPAFTLVTTGKPLQEVAEFIGREEGKEQMDAMQALIAQIGEAELSLLEERTGDSTRLQIITSQLLVFGGIIAIVVALTIAVYLSSSISKSVSRLLRAIRAMADGDLTQEVHIMSSDEMGQMASALNATILRLRELIQSVMDGSGHVAGVSNNLSQSTQESSAAIEEVASTINELAAVIDTMSQDSQAIASAAKQVSQDTGRGRDALENSMTKSDELHNSIKQLADVVADLGERSGQIEQIIFVISGIAEQTNLLALNAAIEAARAGEHGRGFAVVADEVRQLAEQSRKAAANIAELIRGIQEDTAAAITSMQVGADKAQENSVAIKESGDVLEGVLASVDQIIVQIQGVVEGIQQVGSNSQQVAAITEEQSASTQAIAHLTSDLHDLTLKLDELVSQFTLS